MLLAVDIGNTNIVFGLYQGQKLAHSFRVSTDRARTEDEYGVLLRALFSLHSLEAAGVDYDDVIAVLIKEGVDKFVVAWDELQATLSESLEAARA